MPTDMTTSAPAGVIHDIGYQRYTGPRLGRWHAVAAIYAHGLRTAFGLGRTAKAKIFPWLVVGLVTLVAVIMTAVRARFGEPMLNYVQFADAMSLLVFFFVAVVAPELASRDLRSGVLPLYFSRPLDRADYVLAKVAALITATILLLGGPQLLMFVGAAFSQDRLREVWDEFVDLLPGLAYAGLWAVLFATIGMLVASLTGKRAFAAGGIVAVFLMTMPVVGVLGVLPSETVNQLAALASPSTMLTGVGVWLFGERLLENGYGGPEIGDFGPLYGVVTLLLIVACVGLLLARYRKVAAK